MYRSLVTISADSRCARSPSLERDYHANQDKDEATKQESPVLPRLSSARFGDDETPQPWTNLTAQRVSRNGRLLLFMLFGKTEDGSAPASMHRCLRAGASNTDDPREKMVHERERERFLDEKRHREDAS